MRSKGAISIAALTAALAADPAAAAGPSEFEIRYEAEGALAAAAGDGAGVYGEIRLRAQLESITDDGVRWGAVIGAGARRDSGRRAFGGLAGDCPPGMADCPAAVRSGVLRPARGAGGGFYAYGSQEGREIRASLEDAYVYMRGGWGEIRGGYGEGAAALEHLPPPGVFRLLRGDTTRIDPARLAGVRTLNAPSGPAPKLVLRSQRMLGVRAALSFAPRAYDCGLDACAFGDGPGEVVAPRLGDVVEAAASFERRLATGLRLEAAAGYSRADERSGASEFTRYEAVNAAFGVASGPWRAGVSAIRSNNAVSGGRGYAAWSGGVSREAGPWLFALEAGAARDAFAHVQARVLQAGASRLVGDGAAIGAGVQWAERREPVAGPAGREARTRRGAALVIELAWRR
ncbi:MAG: hypothetical protein KIS81_06190 [Maricaulaceae bacterium]|nr:hypothetical protein [Maricaulaceae bacterium]